MLGFYADFGHGSDQYKWLEHDLSKVNRTKTPWLIVIVHTPWYNSGYSHLGEKESVDMKESMEELLYNTRVDVVLAGHIHIYERFNRVYKEKEAICAPVHIPIGDGGNLCSGEFIKPQSETSTFKESSFGHGEFIVAGESFASWSWHRNDDDESVQADTLPIQSIASDPLCNKMII
ncbi:hypothetical protein L1987_61236 [Smallanthus sonchifolius]|uniref:Uncharacterized protein n=1 Tax=Smallanthus sonchifolius TaxID=185202 RepID=A0ACB9DAL0_9ASTR|nr:hypothetical protein L1987_61236 [Smallanthus sonchifolius]